MRPRWTNRALAVAAAALVFAGCGGANGGGEGGGTEGGEVSTTPPDATFPQATVPANSPQPPKHTSPAMRDVYRQFTLRAPDPAVEGSARAIVAGRAACAGQTPVEVERKYFPIAVHSGALDPGSEKARMISETGRYARNSFRDPSFVAGQLAADAYQATLPSKLAPFGYAGCAFSLARQLEREYAARKNRSK